MDPISRKGSTSRMLLEPNNSGVGLSPIQGRSKEVNQSNLSSQNNISQISKMKSEVDDMSQQEDILIDEDQVNPTFEKQIDEDNSVEYIRSRSSFLANLDATGKYFPYNDKKIKQDLEIEEFPTEKFEEVQSNMNLNSDRKEDLFNFEKEEEDEDSDDEELQNKKLKFANQEELEVKERMLANYLNENNFTAFPKILMEDFQITKFKELVRLGPEKIEDQCKNMTDNYPLLETRKKIAYVRKYISLFCMKLIRHSLFDNISLCIILINSLLILISDPRDENSLAENTEDLFLYIYTSEMFIKIFAMGFIMPKHSYIRDVWHMLDFSVICIGWITFTIARVSGGGGASGLGALRTFRILRPLRSIKSIPGLKSIIVTLLDSVAGLKDIIIVLSFFFLIFAIAGVQMWQGLWLRRCFNLELGFVYDESYMCTNDSDCAQFDEPPLKSICVKGRDNPNNGLTHFDNTITGYMTVFIIVTMEGWTEFYKFINESFKDQFGINQWIIDFYFCILLFVGGFYLINLYLAVIKTKFSEIEEANKEEEYVETNLVQLLDKLDKIKAEKTEEEMLEDLKENFTFIEKNTENLELTYQTVADLYLLKINKPEELKQLKKVISEERVIAQKHWRKTESDFKKNKQKEKRDTKNKSTIERQESEETKIEIPIFNYSFKDIEVDEIILGKLVKEANMEIQEELNEKCKVSEKNSSIHTMTKTKSMKQNSLVVPEEVREVEIDWRVKDENPVANIIQAVSEKESSSEEVEERSVARPEESKLSAGQVETPMSIDDSSSSSFYGSRLDQMRETIGGDLFNFENMKGSADPEYFENIKKQRSGKTNMSSNSKNHYKEVLNKKSKIVRISSNFQEIQTPEFKSERKAHERVSSFQRKFSFSINDIKVEKTVKKLQKKRTSKFSKMKSKVESMTVKKEQEVPTKRSKSISKLALKYPASETLSRIDSTPSDRSSEIESLLVEEREVPQKYESYRNYMAYTNNLMDTEFYIVNKIDDSNNMNVEDMDIEGYETDKKIKTRHYHPEDRGIVPNEIFNPDKVPSSNQKNVKYFKAAYDDKDVVNIDHCLTNLPIKALDFMPFKDKNYGMVEKVNKEEGKPTGYTSTFKKKSLRSTQFLKNSMRTLQKSANTMVREEQAEEIDPSLLDKKFLLSSDNSAAIVPPESAPKNNLEIKKQIEDVRVYDLETESRRYVAWSGGDIFDQPNTYIYYDDTLAEKTFGMNFKELNSIISSTEDYGIVLWTQNVFAWFQRLRYFLLNVSISIPFDLFIIGIVIINAIIMSLDGDLLSQSTKDSLAELNLWFNIIFIIEFCIKIVGMGPVLYFSDIFNYVDLLIVIFGVVEMATPSGGGDEGEGGQKFDLKSLSVLRIFRIFRVLRLAKVLRKIKTMRKILGGIGRTIDNVVYICMLLLIFMIIYILLGMSTLNDDPSFQRVLPAFYTVFQILTLENWNSLCYRLVPCIFN